MIDPPLNGASVKSLRTTFRALLFAHNQRSIGLALSFDVGVFNKLLLVL